MTLLDKIRNAQANQAPAFLLNDRHNGAATGRYKADNTQYDFTEGKQGNGTFHAIAKGQKCTTLRAQDDGSVIAVSFIFQGISYQSTHSEGKAMDVHGEEVEREHFSDFESAKVAYPEMFTKSAKATWKRANIIIL
ncbi:hypothetical protein [Vibrio sp. WXL210]|uniref:hypothetical protein n=1 Tax=Vibrio sp. WXL210 TaxID=3450709 RepID=UPI003EC7DF3A